MTRWRKIARFVPLFVSVALVGGLVSWVSPEALAQAAAELPWQLLLPATAAMVVGLYLWDAVCLPIVYGMDGHQLRYREVLHMRGLSYLGGALNYQLGHAAVAWGMARRQQTGILRMLSRSVLLGYHDAVLLLGVGLVGSLLTDDLRVARMRPILAIAFVAMTVIAVVIWNLPAHIRARLRPANTESILTGWSVRRTLRLLPLRLVFFGIVMLYVAVALHLCRVSVNHEIVLSMIPLVLLADGLPNFAGLGTRETSLQLLLDPERPEVLLAMSLFWTTGMMAGRLAIGLGHLWGHQFRRRVAY